MKISKISKCDLVVVLLLALSLPAAAQIDYVVKDAPKEGLAGKIGGKEVTQEELIDLDRMTWLKVLTAQYEHQLNSFTEIMLRRIIGKKAEAAGLELSEYLDKEVVSDVTVSNEEIDGFLISRGVPPAAINDNLRAQGRDFILGAKKREKLVAFLNEIAAENKVEIYIRPPDVRLKIDEGSAPVWGSRKAPVTITIFSDFECPACAGTLGSVNKVKETYADTVRFVFKHSPLNIHPNAIPAAQASVCAFRQKPDVFWPYHDLLYQNQNSLNDTNYKAFAVMTGLNIDKFMDCMASEESEKYVIDDMNYTQSLGIFSTPTFLVNGRPIEQVPSYSLFVQLIDEELEKIKKAKGKSRK